MDLGTRLGPLKLKTPFMAASGTFGFGEEFASLMDLRDLGAIVINGLTLMPRKGNPPPRIVETPAGMLNAIGLQNPGLDVFLSRELPRLQKSQVKLIANIAGDTEEEYVILARELCTAGDVLIAIELNVSCPNVQRGGIFFGTTPSTLSSLVEKVRRVCTLPLIVKLTPNVTDITEIARAAEDGGADILSLVNTFQGMVIDTVSRRPFLGNKIGGLSGPAMRPLAVRLVYETYASVEIPLIGMGGIEALDDALQFFMAGAAAVAIGSASFSDPLTILRLTGELKNYLQRMNLPSLEGIIGVAHG
ncbi:MAG: dihydroorotate dehydrogenase [Dethiobacteria bacterium]